MYMRLDLLLYKVFPFNQSNATLKNIHLHSEKDDKIELQHPAKAAKLNPPNWKPPANKITSFLNWTNQREEIVGLSNLC